MKIIIGQMSDGWCVQFPDRKFSWNHNEPDLGVQALKEMLEYVSRYSVEIEEWY